MKIKIGWARPAISISFLLVACDSGGDSSSATEEPIAQQDAMQALENIQFQNNSRDLLEAESLTPEVLRGYAPEVLRGSVPDFIRGKGAVHSNLESSISESDCASYALDESDPSWIIHNYRFEGDCLVNGVMQSGGFDLIQSNPPEAGGFSIEYHDYRVDGERWDGTVGLASDEKGAGFLIDVFFEAFHSPTKGLIDGTCKVASDRGYYYGYNWEFTGFTLGEGVWDGDYDYTPAGSESAEIVMRLNDQNIHGTYEYKETLLADGNYAFEGKGEYVDQASGQTVSLSFDYSLDLDNCGSIPNEGHMRFTVSGKTTTYRFDCQSVSQE